MHKQILLALAIYFDVSHTWITSFDIDSVEYFFCLSTLVENIHLFEIFNNFDWFAVWWTEPKYVALPRFWVCSVVFFCVTEFFVICILSQTLLIVIFRISYIFIAEDRRDRLYSNYIGIFFIICGVYIHVNTMLIKYPI